MLFNLATLTDKIATLKSNADLLKTAIEYRSLELGAVDNPLVISVPTMLSTIISQELDSINKTLVVLKNRLDSITYGQGPTGYANNFNATGPIGVDSPWGP